MGILKSCKPRKEVLKGDLDDAIFAADFGDLIANKAPKVYGDAKTFFQNTHPAKELCKVIEAVFDRLADPCLYGAQHNHAIQGCLGVRICQLNETRKKRL